MKVDSYVPVSAISFAEHDSAGVVQDEHRIQMWGWGVAG